VHNLRRVLLAALLLLAALATPALAQEAEDDGGEAVQGTLRQEVDGEREPVEGVDITVADRDGNEIATATTDADGEWSVALPGAGAYSATLVEETLPDDVELRDPERGALEFTIRPGQQRTLLFPLGEREGAAATWLPRVAQVTANGVKFGLIIAMTAIGLSLIFGTTGLVNFAHGELVTFGAVVAFFLNAQGPEIPLVFAGVVAVAAGGALGGGLERGLWRPLRTRKTGLIQMLVISIGLALVLRHVLLIFFGGRSRPYADYAVQRAVELGPILLTPRDMTVMALSVALLVGVGLLLQRTRIGKAMRAVADNRDLAESSGIDVQRVILFVWVLGAALAATGGVFLGVVENVSYIMGFRLLLLIFAGVILGGLGTAYGAMVGSLVVGLVTELSTLFFSTELKYVWGLLVLSLVLLFRPQGILGVRERIG
jgi:neutral amino acid transport system permease protein